MLQVTVSFLNVQNSGDATLIIPGHHFSPLMLDSTIPWQILNSLQRISCL